MFYGHYAGFHMHHGHGFSGRGFEAHAFAKILVVIAAFVLAVVARYATTQWVQNEYDDEGKANAAGWIAFLLTLLIVGFAGLKFL